MSSNVGLSTPRGSGTSGYVQRNFAFMKPRNAGYGAPYPPISGANSASDEKPFKQRQPDKEILAHDRLRAIEVKVFEKREELEEENERVEEKERNNKKNKNNDHGEQGEEGEEEEESKVLTEEQIDEKCEELRRLLTEEMEQEDRERDRGNGFRRVHEAGDGRRRPSGRDLPPKERRQFKSYQVHELAEAKIEESERLRKALGIREDKETGEISNRKGEFGSRRRDTGT